jgi:uncharacterized protein
MVAAKVIIEGIVTANFQGSDALRGFFEQEEVADMDADPSTSEGIFVYDTDFGVDVQMGDQVAVQGTVAEYYDLTKLTIATSPDTFRASVHDPARIRLHSN